LGIEFHWHTSIDGNVGVTLTQQSFTESMLDNSGYSSDTQFTFTTPYQSGISIDTIPITPMSTSEQDALRL
jgi:hypothetical protein